MGIFGIGGRGNRPAPLGNISQQSVTKISAGIVTARTVMPVTSGNSDFPMGTVRLPEKIIRIQPLLFPPNKTYEQDTLNLSEFNVSPGNGFEAIEKNGISVFRPEILSVMTFQPIDGPNNITSTAALGGSPGQLIKMNYQATEIRTQTLQKLIQDIRRKTQYRVPLDAVKNLFVSKINSTQTALMYFSTILKRVDAVKTSLDPKKIPKSSYNTSNYLPMPDFFDRKMQFSKNKFAIFSDTKVLNQLTSDLKNILEGYSFSLLDVSDSDRVNDYNPVKIDKTYTQTNGFTFSIASLRSQNQEIIAAYKPSFFNQFLNSLPSLPDNKIKLLTNILSKELRVSKQLGKPEVAATLLSSYGQTDNSNPFNNICGLVGDTIFDPPQGNNSIASLTYTQGPNGETILPFESLFVDSESDGKTFIPGSSYFGDNILNISQTTGFNTQPFVDFSTKYNEKLTLASSTIKTLLDLEDSLISSENIYDLFLLSIYEASSGLVNQTGIDKSQAVCLSLFKLANTDPELKQMLFEYLLILGMMSNSPEDRKVVFERLAYEIKTIQKFTYAPLTTFDSPNLLEGSSTLRPYLEGISKKIEDKVYSLLNPTSYKNMLDKTNIAKLSPYFGAEVLGAEVSGPTRTLTSAGSIARLPASVKLALTGQGEYLTILTSGELKNILINAATSVGSSTTNICKEFVDLSLKFDQLTSVAGTSNYLVQDLSGRTRFNFMSTSTQMLLTFEILSSFVNKYSWCSLSKAAGVSKTNCLINTAATSFISKSIRDIISDKLKSKSSLIDIALANKGSIIGLAGSALNNETVRGGSTTYTLNPLSPGNIVPANALTPTFTLTPIRVDAGRTSDISVIIPASRYEEYNRTLVGNRKKLKDEDTTVLNILHIFDVINGRLIVSREAMTTAFSFSALTSFLSSTGVTFEELSLIKNPAQIRTSSWIFDRYDEKLSDITDLDSSDVGTGFLITDRISQTELNVLEKVLSQPDFSYNSMADQFVKIVSVGLPSGFSKNISDRVSKQSISDTNFNNKQFDVVSINVYKRDARYDDIVFKPQKFIFDLSLFPIKNFLPPLLDGLNQSYSTIINSVKFRDYENLSLKKNVNLSALTADEKYNFLSLEQRSDLVENHLRSQMFELYIRLMLGMRIDEETFSTVDYSKLSVQDDIISGLIVNYLKNVRYKNIPNQPLAELLTNEAVDQETKDIIRLLSYGNIMFQADFIKKRILQQKLFDRIFHFPLDIRKFEIDVETTISTEAGKQMFKQNSVQNQIILDGKEYYFNKIDRNQASFEDIFVVVESNLRNT